MTSALCRTVEKFNPLDKRTNLRFMWKCMTVGVKCFLIWEMWKTVNMPCHSSCCKLVSFIYSQIFFLFGFILENELPCRLTYQVPGYRWSPKLKKTEYMFCIRLGINVGLWNLET
jgi:hypothetical protein